VEAGLGRVGTVEAGLGRVGIVEAGLGRVSSTLPIGNYTDWNCPYQVSILVEFTYHASCVLNMNLNLLSLKN